MSRFDRLLARVEELSIALHDQQNTHNERMATYEQEARGYRNTITQLRGEITRLTNAAEGKERQRQHAEMRQAIADILSIGERPDLSDAERWKSMLNLAEQIAARSYFAVPREMPVKAQRTTKNAADDAAVVDAEVSAAGTQTLPNADTSSL